MSHIRRADRVEASLIRRMFDLAAEKRRAGADLVDLSIGQPHLPPAQELIRAAADALATGNNGYLPTSGDPQLLDALREYLRQRHGSEPESVMITAGASGALTLAILALAEPGDDVLLPDPYFVSYPQLCHIAGARPIYYDTYPDFRLRPEAVEAAMTDATRLIVINSPANPTGAVFGADELQAVGELAQRRGVAVLSDEIYDTIVFDPPHVSMAPFCERTVTVGGWGKSLAITGWRIGYAAGPADIIDRMTNLQQFTYVCVPGPVQQAVLACRNLWDAPHPNSAAEIYRRQRDRICEALSSAYRFVRPAGAFYLFPEAPGGDASAFCERAIERGVLVIPGGGFSRRDSHFRISFAADDEQLERGIERLLALASEDG